MTSSAQQAQDRLITRRDYLHVVAVLAGADLAMARDVVNTIAAERPEWDLDGATDTFDGWERRALQAHGVRLAAAVRQQAGRWDKEHVLLVEGQTGAPHQHH